MLALTQHYPISLTIVEGIIEFAIDIYRSTFLCFLELIVRGSLGILIGAVQTAGTPSLPTLFVFANFMWDTVL